MTPFKKFKKDFENKRVLIFGLGLLGRGAGVAKLFAEIGCSVVVTDRKTREQLKDSINKLDNLNISYTLGKHRQEDIDSSQIIIRNPDVEWHHPLLNHARKKKIPIYMDTSLFAKYFSGTLIGITGTRGKTTTTMLTYELVKNIKPNSAILAGNATPNANLSLLKNAKKSSIAIAELSSWELQGFYKENLSPRIAVVTNVYLDHMDHYTSFNEYLSDKEAIFQHQNKTDYVLLNRENSWTRKMAAKVKSRLIWFTSKDYPSQWNLQLLGKHNLENAAAAYQVGLILGYKKNQMKKTFEDFRGVAHRLESVAEINGIEFINDTTSTTPIATIKALQAVSKPVILLIGGNSKDLPISQMAKEVVKKVKAIVLLRGTGSVELKRELEKYGKVKILAIDLAFKKSVRIAAENADPGDVVLLSPGYTSYAEFNNIFERGESFKRVLKNLKIEED